MTNGHENMLEGSENPDIDRLLNLIAAEAKGIEVHNAQEEAWLKLFLVVVSGAIAISTILFRSPQQEDLLKMYPWIIPVSLVILLVYGFVTLHSMSWRKRYKNEQIEHVMILQRHLVLLSPVIHRAATEFNNLRIKLESGRLYRRTLRGSVREFVYLTNSLVVVAILFYCFWGWQGGIGVPILCMAGGFIATIFLQYWYCRWVIKVPTDQPR